jgi:hypothetical protein
VNTRIPFGKRQAMLALGMPAIGEAVDISSIAGAWSAR